MISIYGNLWHSDTITVQQWAEPILDSMILVQSYKDFSECRNSIIFASPKDANTHFDLTKLLLEQNNFFVWVTLGETISSQKDWHDMAQDLPFDISHFPWIDASTLKTSNTLGLECFLFRTHGFNNKIRAQHIQQQKKKQRPYKFLYLNGRHVPHRLRLWKKLNDAGILDFSLRSYLGYANPRMPWANDPDIPFTFLPQEYSQKYEKIDKTTPDWIQQHRSYKAWKGECWQGQWVDGQIDPISLYTDTYFSVVTETTAGHLDPLFVTEKTFKPIIAGHPFIVLGSPGLYQYLQNLGFETYHRDINETFDNEVDLDQRIKLISLEIVKLCQIDLDKFVQNTQEIATYNQQHYQDLIWKHYLILGDQLKQWCSHYLVQGKNYIISQQSQQQ